MKLVPFFVLTLIAALFSQTILGQESEEFIDAAHRFEMYYLAKDSLKLHASINPRNKITVKKIILGNKKHNLELELSDNLCDLPIRDSLIVYLTNKFKQYLPESYQDYNITFFAGGRELSEYIPNYYRLKEKNYDKERLPVRHGTRPERKLVIQKQQKYLLKNGLQNANIALWSSHGWYYNNVRDRWEWQRSRLFTTAEDLLTTSIVVPYLIPMLENAGANVWSARERDYTPTMLIADSCQNAETWSISAQRTGFATPKRAMTNENPFQLGSYYYKENARKSDSLVYAIPITHSNEYGVHISYAKGSGKAIYKVYHAGGITQYTVDQTMAYGTWVDLGRFRFEAKTTAYIVVQPERNGERILTADAVRLGGGMGNVSRNGQTSGKPRWAEAARYHEQFSGAPKASVWSLHNDSNDYTDDYQGRGEWVNWLLGGIFGPTITDSTSLYKGLNIPIDLAFALHTDSGLFPKDSIVGTLAIYSDQTQDGRFPDQQSKIASRDLADLIQTQVVNDTRAQYRKNWTRRGLWNAKYSEAARPNVPSMLLELLSHQNPADVEAALDPNYRFLVARSIYKGMLRFLSVQHTAEYLVQPLPPQALATQLTKNKAIRIHWEATTDSLEPTAKPEFYIVYQSYNDQAYDNGTLVKNSEYLLPSPKSGIYNFRVAAVNSGGESLLSDEVSVGFTPYNDQEILIVNTFERLAAPTFLRGNKQIGFFRTIDPGVADNTELSTVGEQKTYNPNVPFTDNDSPGFGASYSDLEAQPTLGNTHNYAQIHGKSILANGYNFTTYSRQYFDKANLPDTPYFAIDILAGAQKSTETKINKQLKYQLYTARFLRKISEYTQQGSHILLTGSYLGSETLCDTSLTSSIQEILGLKFHADHAVKKPDIYLLTNRTAPYRASLRSPEHYLTPSPDALAPAAATAKVWARYAENNFSAAILYSTNVQILSLTTPIETLDTEAERTALFNQILGVFANSEPNKP
jgi:hypothetical protein